MAESFFEHFAILPDPRVQRTRRHELSDIVAVALLGVICGAEGWTEIAEFGEAKEGWLKTFLNLPNGIPSHDTFGRVFAALDPEEFERCFQAWTADLADASAGRIIAIDGKTLRRSFDRANGKSAVHLVSAWVQGNHTVFGQVRTDEKSNEITAIPRLLGMLNLNGATVTLDAMGCQKQIARAIVDKGADYVLAVKGNQGSLREDVQVFMDDVSGENSVKAPVDVYETVEKDHGRVETRRVWSTSKVKWLAERTEWPGVQSLAVAECERRIHGQRSVERRYYISSMTGRSAKRLAEAIRGHWSIENNLHWMLDVVFREDDCRVRVGNAAENLSRLRRMALNLLKRETTSKRGIKCKRLRAGWDHGYLLKILGI